MRNLVKGSTCYPSEAVVRGWLKGIQELTGTEVVYTPEVYKILVGRANCFNATVHKLSKAGGRQMKEYLAKDWEFKVPSTSIIKSLQHKNSDLQQKARDLEASNKSLQQQISFLSAKQAKEAETEVHTCTRGK